MHKLSQLTVYRTAAACNELVQHGLWRRSVSIDSISISYYDLI